MNIRKFNDKSIAVYHGLGGSPIDDRAEHLKSIGYNNILYPHIDYESEWSKDRCKSLFYDQIDKIKDVDIIVGNSLGGYLAFELAGYLSKNLILINPALDPNDEWTIDIREFDTPHKFNFKNIEVFFGENDTLIPKKIAIKYLERLGIKSSQYIIENMGHSLSRHFFSQIIQKSKLIRF